MDRSIVLLFSDGSWDYGCSYSIATHGHRGKYHEVVVGSGWSARDISDMLKQYFEENAENIF